MQLEEKQIQEDLNLNTNQNNENKIVNLEHMKSYTFTEEELKDRAEIAMATCLMVAMIAGAAGQEAGKKLLDALPEKILEIFTKD